VREEESRLAKKPITEQLELFEPDNVWHYAGVKGLKIPRKLSNLRQKLYQKAKQEPKFRFYVLYDRIYRPDVLAFAYKLAKAKGGAEGVDGVRFEDIEKSPEGEQGLLDKLHEDLKAKTYQPSAVLRAYIPKPDGRKRPLGIPTIRDRVAQMAALLIVEPIFEADFEDCSHGFRPGRSAHDALEDVRKNLKEGRNGVYDADLAGYFDSIPHEKLIKCLEMRIADRSVLKLIRMWLKAPVVDNTGGGGPSVTRRGSGTPQGGVISPLLANIYLHWFDKVFHRSDGPIHWADARMVRYADDFVVMARYQGGRLSKFIETKIESWLGLRLNRDKTRVINLRNPGESFDFLGYTYRYDRDLRGRNWRYLNVTPSKKALQAERDKLREIMRAKRCFVPLPRMIDDINKQVRGWANYFSVGYPRRAHREVNRYVRARLTRHVRRRSQRPFRPPQGRSYYKHFKVMGLVYL